MVSKQPINNEELRYIKYVIRKYLFGISIIGKNV